MSVFQQRVSLQYKCNLNGEFHSSKPEKRDWKCHDTFEEEKKSLLEALLSKSYDLYRYNESHFQLNHRIQM